MRTRTLLARTAATGCAALLILTACAGDDGDADADDGGVDDAADEEPTDDEEEVATGQGFDDCLEIPNTCNSGERAEGGSMIWTIEQTIPGWLAITAGQGDVYTLQAIHGILPHTGSWQPDGVAYEHNMDLLAEEPVLLSDGSDGEQFSYQFQIREEAVWDDGTPISADDFRVLWLMSTSEAEGRCVGCNSRSSSAFDRIESVEGSDDGKTVTITLKEGERDAEWFQYGDSHGITGGLVPAHLAEQQGWDIDDPDELGEYSAWLHSTIPTYSGGPYKIVEGDVENQVIKEPNENWYGEVQPTLDTLIIRFLTDAASWPVNVANNETHGGNPVQLDEDLYQQFVDMPNVLVNLGPGPGWEHIDFNMDVPAFDDVNLRQAIFTAIDADRIGNANFGQLYPEWERRLNPVFPQNSPYFVDVVSERNYASGDATAALAILEDAGYEFDGQTLTLDGEQVGPFRLRSTEIPTRVTARELVQAQLAEIGVEIIIDEIPAGQLGAVLSEQDYDLAIYGWSGSPSFVGTAAQLWQTGIGSNFGNYSNPEFDALALQAQNAADFDEAALYSNEGMEILMDDAYVLPLYDTPVYLYVTDEFINIRDNQASSLRGQYNHHEWGVAAQ